MTLEELVFTSKPALPADRSATKSVVAVPARDGAFVRGGRSGRLKETAVNSDGGSRIEAVMFNDAHRPYYVRPVRIIEHHSLNTTPPVRVNGRLFQPSAPPASYKGTIVGRYGNDAFRR